MTRKSNFERLGPADQLAIESMVTNAKKEELEAVFKETKSKEAMSKRFDVGGFIIGIIMIIVILGFIASISLEFSVYQDALKSAGIAVCQSHNSTYKDINFEKYFHVTIICTDFKVRLP